ANLAAFHAGNDADAIAATLGAYGATKLYTTGDLGGHLPEPPVSAAMKAVIDGGDVPAGILLAQPYEGRHRAGRLAVKLDRTVLTNNIDIAVDGDDVSVTTAIFGGNVLVTTTFTGDAPRIALFRPKSFAAEESGGGPAEVVKVDVPDAGATGAARVTA